MTPSASSMKAAREIADAQWLDTFDKATLTARIAEAIDGAKQEEREACAKIADPKRKRPKMNLSNHKPPINRDSAMAMSLRKEIAKAIRSRTSD